MTDSLLLVPVGMFVASTAYATAVAATEPGLPGEPFGLHLPGRVRRQLALGLGSAISAPWPMPAISTWAAVQGSAGSTWAARTVALVGTGLLAGTLAEPVTWGRRPASRMARATIPLHLAVGAAMVSAAAYRLRQQAGAAPGSGQPNASGDRFQSRRAVVTPNPGGRPAPISRDQRARVESHRFASKCARPAADTATCVPP